jgi:hypothetical protein
MPLRPLVELLGQRVGVRATAGSVSGRVNGLLPTDLRRGELNVEGRIDGILVYSQTGQSRIRIETTAMQCYGSARDRGWREGGLGTAQGTKRKSASTPRASSEAASVRERNRNHAGPILHVVDLAPIGLLVARGRGFCSLHLGLTRGGAWATTGLVRPSAARAVNNAPSATNITLLFTDVEGSTRLWETGAHGRSDRPSRRFARTAVVEHRGVKTTGWAPGGVR